MSARNCLILASALAAFLAGCEGGEDGGTAPTSRRGPVTVVSVTPTAASLAAGHRLEIRADPRDARGTVMTGRAVEWSSSDPTVAVVAVSANPAVIEGLAPGEVTITARSEGVSGTATLTVVAAVEGPPFVVSNSREGRAFVSLPQGTLPFPIAVPTTLNIRVQRTGTVVTVALPPGGLDPVAVPAVAGDLLFLSIAPTAARTDSRSGTAASPWVYPVPLQRTPVLIRTAPRQLDRDLALNARLEMVFSEPLEAGTLTSQTVALRADGQAIAGQAAFANPEHTVVHFTPTAHLAPATDYVLELAPGISDLDGERLGVATTVAFATAPLLAPQLAFVRDGQIYAITPDGGLLQLTRPANGMEDSHPSWSPDGGRLAFARGDLQSREWDIYVMNADGTDQVRLTNGGHNAEPVWAPDGRTIAFTSQLDGNAGISVVDGHGGAGGGVILDRPGWDAMPAWSPDGRRITFTSDWRAFDFLYDLYVMDADGSNVRPLLEGPFFSADSQIFYFQSAWSPDGEKIATVICPYAWDNCYPASAIAVANADGTGLHVVAAAGGYARPTWSPDGRAIAFGSAACRTCPSSIRFVRVDRSEEGLILANGHSPAWRPR